MSTPHQKTFFGHPYPLSALFHIELWERFSFYGMQAILLFYLYFNTTQGGLGINKATAGGITAAYSGSIYMATLLGGWISDRVLGSERTLFYSAMVVMLGHITLAVMPNVSGLMLGLLFVALGSGGVKACASTMVGSLYESPEVRHLRDAGFSLFYLSINIGGLLGPLVSGWLQSSPNFGFHYGFGAAAVGMAGGLTIYSMGRKGLPLTPAIHPLTAAEKSKVMGIFAAIVAVIVGLIVFHWLRFDNFKDVLFVVVLMVTLGYFTRLLMNSHKMGGNQQHILAYIPMFLATCAFWAVWYQVYTVVSIYFEGTMDRHIGGFEIPEAWLGSAQSLWVITLAGVMSTLWMKMGKKQPKTPLKFALALLLVGLAYVPFLPFTLSGSVLPLAMMMVVLFLLTVAELLISPISLSFATKIAPKQFKTQMVALNFLALSIGFTGGGKLFAGMYDEHNLSAYFMLLVGIGVVSGVILLVCVPFLNKLLSDID